MHTTTTTPPFQNLLLATWVLLVSRTHACARWSFCWDHLPASCMPQHLRLVYRFWFCYAIYHTPATHAMPVLRASSPVPPCRIWVFVLGYGFPLLPPHTLLPRPHYYQHRLPPALPTYLPLFWCQPRLPFFFTFVAARARSATPASKFAFLYTPTCHNLLPPVDLLRAVADRFWFAATNIRATVLVHLNIPALLGFRSAYSAHVHIYILPVRLNT